MPLSERLAQFIDAAFGRQTAFLAELVKIPSDNPPGDCAPHATRAQTSGFCAPLRVGPSNHSRRLILHHRML